MKSWEYNCVEYEGEIYCINCLPDGVDAQSGNVNPVFACSEWDSYPVCAVCGMEHDYVILLEAE